MHKERKKNNNDNYNTINDYSQNLEKHSIEVFMVYISNEKRYGIKFILVKYCHDHDGQAKFVVMKYYLKAKEQSCTSHMSKNVVKPLNSSWKGRIKKCILYCIKGKPSVEQLKIIFSRYLKHYINDHSECIDCKSTGKVYLNLLKKTDFKIYFKISDIFNYIITNWEMYKDGQNTSLIESMNNCIRVLTRKGFSYSKTYDIRVDCTLLRLKKGECYIKEILESLNTSICDKTLHLLKNYNLKKQRRLTSQRTNESKDKKRKAKAYTNIINNPYEDKSKYYGTNEIHRLINSDYVPKRRKNGNGCGCKTGCNTKRCKCYKGSQLEGRHVPSKCSNECNCVNCLNK